jgi:hypothetical protein
MIPANARTQRVIVRLNKAASTVVNIARKLKNQR